MCRSAVVEGIAVCAADRGAGSQSRQQPVDAVDDLIEKGQVISMHSEHHLAGMTGDAPAMAFV